MGLQRLAVAAPSANTDTTVYTATDQYLMSVILTNKSSSSATMRVWVEPSGSSSSSQYAYIIYDVPLDGNNSYETFRFAVNQNDVVKVRVSTADISVAAYGLVQYDINLGVGISSYQSTAPSNPVQGMIWVDSDNDQMYVYDGADWNLSALTTATGIPTQTGNNGEFLTTDGTVTSWSTEPIIKNPSVDQTITAANATTTPLIIKGASGQSDNYFEVKDSSNNLRTAVANDGSLFIGRTDATQEGGEVKLARSTDNASSWSMDVYGSTSTPSLRFVDNTAAATRMTIDGSGRITIPNQPAFCINQNGGTWTSNQIVVFSTTTHINVGSCYSTANGRFTAPVSGNYFFSLTYLTPDSAATFDVRLRKNGSTNFGGSYSGAANASYKNGGVVGIINLAANDYVEIVAFGASNSLHGDASHNVYSGHLIG